MINKNRRNFLRFQALMKIIFPDSHRGRRRAESLSHVNSIFFSHENEENLWKFHIFPRITENTESFVNRWKHKLISASSKRLLLRFGRRPAECFFAPSVMCSIVFSPTREREPKRNQIELIFSPMDKAMHVSECVFIIFPSRLEPRWNFAFSGKTILKAELTRRRKINYRGVYSWVGSWLSGKVRLLGFSMRVWMPKYKFVHLSTALMTYQNY